MLGPLPEEAQDAQETLALIKTAGRLGVGIPGDIKSESFCQQLVETVVKELGGLDIVSTTRASNAPPSPSWN